jgi:phage shock protein A
MLNQAIYDMQTQLVEAKKQVAVVIADERRLHRQANEAAVVSSQWERRAEMAVRAGDDNLARAALARRAENEQLSTAFREQWEAQKRSAEALRAALHGLSNKIDEAHRQRRVLIARQRRAQAQAHIAQTLSNINASSPIGVLERMEERVCQIEAQAEAAYDLSEHAIEPSLEAQFRALEAGNVEDELDALKRRMGLRAAEERRALYPASNAN